MAQPEGITVATTDGPHAAGDVEAGCFHCGRQLVGPVFTVTLDGATRDTCCRGCQAVARTIIDNGLGAYYRNRTALAPAAPGPDVMPADLGLYDLPEVQRGVVRDVGAGGHEKETALLIDGVTCAACVWLIEQRLARVPGVRTAILNYASRRARVCWDARETTLRTILQTVSALGYGAQPYDVGRAEARLEQGRRALLWRLFIAGFSAMQVMMYAVPVYIADGAMTRDIEQLMRIASLILTVPVALWAAAPFYAGAVRDLRAGRVGMDVPVALGIVIAFASSVWATWTATGQVYFDSVAMFVFLLLGARYLEMGAQARAVETQERLLRMVPATAERMVAYPGVGTERVAAATLRIGDYARLRPGATIPADGLVVDGISAADEALLTGEVRPVTKRPGDALTGGSVNLEGMLTMRITRVGEDTMLASMVRLMDRAQSTKPRIAQTADRVAQWFVGAVLAFTLAVFAAWWHVDASRALWVAVSLLVVSCPCALSLATPMALTAATGAALRGGVLVTRGSALETLARATHFVFDKTGTLTTGRMTLATTRALGAELPERCLGYAAALEACSEHPVGRALVAAAPGVHPVAGSVRNVPGQGVEGMVAGRLMRIGRPDFVAELHQQVLPDDALGAAGSVASVALGDAHGWLAWFQLDDSFRYDAWEMVRELVNDGVGVTLLSGDHPERAARAARALGIPEVHGGATPADKLAFVRALQRQGAIVAMVGDGVNDAPVLAQAQVSMAMGSGTDLAQLSADIVLLADRLAAVVDARRMARRALRVIRQNLGWAVAYNAVALPLATAGLVTPLLAAAGMSASSLLVVLNAMRLRREVRR